MEVLDETCDARKAELEAWLAEQDAKVEADVDPDTLIEAVDPYSRQLLALTAEATAADDALYHLDRALGNGSVELPVFLKEVRKLARKHVS